MLNMKEISLIQVAGSVSPPSPHSSSHSSTFPITPFPRGITQSWLLLLITHGPQKCSSCLEKWDHCRAGGSAAADELGEKWKLIKSFKLAWKTKEREI